MQTVTTMDPNIRDNILEAMNALSKTRDEQIKWLEEFICDVSKQEAIINVTKTGTLVVSVASAVALFTPFAVLGVAGLAGSGLATVGTTIGSYIANKIHDGELKKKLEQSNYEETRLQELLGKPEQLYEDVSKELGRPMEMALRLVLLARDIERSTANEHTAAAKLVFGTGQTAVSMVEAIPKLKQMSDVMEFGYGFGNAARVAKAVNVAIVVEETGQGVNAVYQLTGSVVGTMFKFLGVAGAVFGVADVIYSWSKDNPCVASARQCLEKVQRSREDLAVMRIFFE